ncbi:MAG: hypothetical protein ACMUIG_10510 [Thermoplasmatota archaeon]
MGILDEIEKIDEEDGVKGMLKRIEKLEEENNKILKEIRKMLKTKKKGGSKK